jgi:glutamine synthetase
MLRAGLDGIRRELTAPAPNEEDLYHLDEAGLRRLTAMPGSLGEAIGELERSELVRETFGDHLFERYLDGRRQEWDEYRLSVSDWELERYLPIY